MRDDISDALNLFNGYASGRRVKAAYLLWWISTKPAAEVWRPNTVDPAAVYWAFIIDNCKNFKPDGETKSMGPHTTESLVKDFKKAGLLKAGQEVKNPAKGGHGRVEPIELTNSARAFLKHLREEHPSWFEEWEKEDDSTPAEPGATAFTKRKPKTTSGFHPPRFEPRSGLTVKRSILVGAIASIVITGLVIGSHFDQSTSNPITQGEGTESTYSIIYEYVSDVNFYTWVTGCGNENCSKLITRPYTAFLDSSNNPEDYQKQNLMVKHNVTGEDRHIEYHYTHGYLGHVYVVKTTNSTQSGPHTITIEFNKKDSCQSSILGVEVLEEGTGRVFVVATIDSAFNRGSIPEHSKIPNSIRPYYSSDTQINLTIIDRHTEEEVIHFSKSHKVFMNATDDVRFEWASYPGEFIFRVETSVTDSTCLSQTSRTYELTRRFD